MYVYSYWGGCDNIGSGWSWCRRDLECAKMCGPVMPLRCLESCRWKRCMCMTIQWSMASVCVLCVCTHTYNTISIIMVIGTTVTYSSHWDTAVCTRWGIAYYAWPLKWLPPWCPFAPYIYIKLPTHYSVTLSAHLMERGGSCHHPHCYLQQGHHCCSITTITILIKHLCMLKRKEFRRRGRRERNGGKLQTVQNVPTPIHIWKLCIHNVTTSSVCMRCSHSN